MKNSYLISWIGCFLFGLPFVLFAQTTPSPPASDPAKPDYDVLGLTLKMSQPEIREAINKKYPNANSALLQAALQTDDYSVNPFVGLVADVGKPNPYEQSTDRIQILFDTSNGIFAISRKVSYSDTKITMQTLRDSLFEKYGPPKFKLTNDVYREFYAWPKGNYDPKDWMLSSSIDRNHSFFYENVQLDTSIAYVQSGISGSFSDVINSINGINKPPYPPQRPFPRNNGEVVTAYLVSSLGQGDNPYASTLYVSLVNLTKGVDVLSKYSTDFFAKSEELKKAREAKDSENKPSL